MFCASTKKPPSKPWIGSIPFCRFRRDERSVMASSTTGMERLLCMQRWTPRPAVCTGRTTARHTSRDFVAFLEEVLSLCSPRHADSYHPRAQPLGPQTQLVRDFLQQHPARAAALHLYVFLLAQNQVEILGSPRSNARSSPAAFSPRSRTWLANSVVTSTPTPPMLARSSGNIPHSRRRLRTNEFHCDRLH